MSISESNSCFTFALDDLTQAVNCRLWKPQQLSASLGTAVCVYGRIEYQFDEMMVFCHTIFYRVDLLSHWMTAINLAHSPDPFKVPISIPLSPVVEKPPCDISDLFYMHMLKVKTIRFSDAQHLFTDKTNPMDWTRIFPKLRDAGKIYQSCDIEGIDEWKVISHENLGEVVREFIEMSQGVSIDEIVHFIRLQEMFKRVTREFVSETVHKLIDDSQ